MAVRSRPLAAISTLTNGAFTTLYTVPAGRTAIVRHWSVVNHHTGTLTVRLAVRIAGALVDVYRQASLVSGEAFRGTDWYLALGPGDQLAVFVSGGSGAMTVHVVAAGSLLDGVPT